MRTGIWTTLAFAAAMALTACGDDEPDGTDGTNGTDGQAATEAELDEARNEADQLRAENEELRQQLETAEGDDGDDGDDGDGEPEQGPVGEPQPLRSPEGLAEQLRTLFPQSTGPDGGFEPGTTEWRSAEVPEGLEERYDSLGELAFALAEARHGDSMGADQWESTVRVLIDDEDPDQAYVAVLSWGLADDATIGRDLRVTVTATDDGGWSPGGAEERSHCSRGVVDGACN